MSGEQFIEMSPGSLTTISGTILVCEPCGSVVFPPLAEAHRRSHQRARRPSPALPPDLKLVERPSGGQFTDDFLESVAQVYRWLVDAGAAPAPGIAKSADVPVRTVHRWVSEARKGGFLPPGTRGKAG